MFKCELCDASFKELEDLKQHLDDEHHDEIPKNFTVAQFYYYLKTGKDHGSCIVCKRDTPFNESTGKYARFCGRQECKDTYKEEFRKRMIGKYGKVHLLNDPTQQKKMLANRSISGKYRWSDGKEIQFTGSYEKDFLRFLDVFMNFESSDIMSPSPHTYYYNYEGAEKFYIPDFFIPSLNLEIEIKDGGDNPNTHYKIQAVDKVKEKLKDDVLTSQSQFHYIKITNKNYDGFFDFLMRLKKQFQEEGDKGPRIFILDEAVTVTADERKAAMESVTEWTEEEIDSKLHEYMTALESVDDVMGIEAEYFEAETVMEAFYDKQTRATLNKTFNSSYRKRAGFALRNMDLLFMNLTKNAQKTGNFEGIRPNLLKIIDRCKSQDELGYLRRDKNAGKYMLTKLAKNKPELAPQIKEHLKWMETTYTEAINTKAKELRTKGVTESAAYTRAELRLQYFSQIAHEGATQEELEYLVEIMDAEEKALASNMVASTDGYASRLQTLKKSVQQRIAPVQEATKVNARLFNAVELRLEYYKELVKDNAHHDEIVDAVKEIDRQLEELKGKAESNEYVMKLKEYQKKLLRLTAKNRMPVQEASTDATESKDLVPVYVLLTHSGTVLANAIKSVTKNPYSHASISFDTGLENMYSFGRKYKNNPLIGTFVKESIKAGLYEDVSETATYSLYVTFVTVEQRALMQQKLQYFKDRHDQFKYNFTGLIMHQLGRESHREDAYFCSQFVDTILRSGREYFHRHSSLVKPYDFAKHKDFFFVTKGNLKNYDSNKVLRLVSHMTARRA